MVQYVMWTGTSCVLVGPHVHLSRHYALCPQTTVLNIVAAMMDQKQGHYSAEHLIILHLTW